jgi:pyridinium-3,5-biscarboxylic acid mononucleotide sulfurtransferase
MDGIDEKLARLAKSLREMGSVLVCYSGGVDSAFVLAMATRELGARAVGLTAVSPSLPPGELDEARALAQRIGADHRVVESHEMDDPNYVANPADRCFYCKSELYRIALDRCSAWGLGTVVNGTNCDDLGDYRPGLTAAARAGVASPLVACGFTKSDVRAGAKSLGLEVWDKPAAACLSSRIPYGTSVTRERLTQIGGFEAELKRMGFLQVRVRYHDKLARIEVGKVELARAVELSTEIVATGKRHGFSYVTLDLGGYRTGSHNEVISGKSLRIV